MFSQTTGLKVTSSVPTDNGMKSNVSIRFNEFYLNKSLNSQFNVYTELDGNSITGFASGDAIGKVYSFQLSSIPDLNMMWDSVANRLTAQGLTVVKLP